MGPYLLEVTILRSPPAGSAATQTDPDVGSHRVDIKVSHPAGSATNLTSSSALSNGSPVSRADLYPRRGIVIEADPLQSCAHLFVPTKNAHVRESRCTDPESGSG